MSAYIVEDTTINTVVTFLYAKAKRTPWRQANARLLEAGIACEGYGQARELAQAMHALNVQAVNARYELTDDPGDFKFKCGNAEAKPFHQVVKSLDCWLYQCTEGNVPQTSKLYKAMVDIRDLLCRCYVISSREYKAAKWG